MVARKRPIVKSKKRRASKARKAKRLSGTTKRKPYKKRKKKKKAKNKRSIAAKKGWETRRRKQRALKRRLRKQAQRHLEHHPELEGTRERFAEELQAREQAATVEKRARLNDAERREIRMATIEEYTEALRPLIGARASVSAKARLIAGELLEETEESIILNRLINAENFGFFDDEAYAIADEYDWDPNEVYGLWHGYLDT